MTIITKAITEKKEQPLFIAENSAVSTILIFIKL